MTSFGWKRKTGDKVVKKASVAFEENAADEEDEAVTSGEVDWLTLVPKRRIVRLEDGKSKASRLREEGVILAGEERCWEALRKWDEALEYNESDETIHEMKAQVYMQLGEVFPAVQAAKKAVMLKPQWWVAHQTQGRALLGLGEVKAALRSFCKAVHLHPVDAELWEEDLRWAVSLVQRLHAAKEEKKREKELSKAARIVELDTDGQSTDLALQQHVQGKQSQDGTTGELDKNHKYRRKRPAQGYKLPPNYVCLRD